MLESVWNLKFDDRCLNLALDPIFFRTNIVVVLVVAGTRAWLVQLLKNFVHLDQKDSFSY